MPDFIIIYLSIALSGALISWYRIFLPVRYILKAEGAKNNVYVTKPILTSIIWIVLAALVIPFLARSLLSDKARDESIKQVYQGAKDD